MFKIWHNFNETYIVEGKSRIRRPKIATSDETSLNVLLSVEENTNVFSRLIALNEGISQCSVLCIVKLEKFHSLKVHLIHKFVEDYFDHTLQFYDFVMKPCVKRFTPTLFLPMKQLLLCTVMLISKICVISLYNPHKEQHKHSDLKK